MESAPGVIRTPDLWIRSPSLYPAELRARRISVCIILYIKARESATAHRGGKDTPCRGRRPLLRFLKRFDILIHLVPQHLVLDIRKGFLKDLKGLVVLAGVHEGDAQVDVHVDVVGCDSEGRLKARDGLRIALHLVEDDAFEVVGPRLAVCLQDRLVDVVQGVLKLVLFQPEFGQVEARERVPVYSHGFLEFPFRLVLLAQLVVARAEPVDGVDEVRFDLQAFLQSVRRLAVILGLEVNQAQEVQRLIMTGVKGQGQVHIIDRLFRQAVLHGDDGFFILVLRVFFGVDLGLFLSGGAEG